MVKILKWLLIFILMTSLISAAKAATLHGMIYDWSDFETPLKNAIVEINSTPPQYEVASSGTYSFNLSPGSYYIKAGYYRNNVLELTTTEVLTVDSEGDFVHDLLLFPPTDIDEEYLGDINLTSEMEIKTDNDPSIYVFIIIILVIFLILLFYWIKKRKIPVGEPKFIEPQKEKSETVVETVVESKELPGDLKDLYDMILKTGGRTTQKDLRKKMTCSEAKVSLMLDDLENRGFIKKIKKGRSNIIIAENLQK